MLHHVHTVVGEHLPVTREEQQRMKSVFKRKMTPLARKLTLDFGSTMQKIVDRVRGVLFICMCSVDRVRGVLFICICRRRTPMLCAI